MKRHLPKRVAEEVEEVERVAEEVEGVEVVRSERWCWR